MAAGCGWMAAEARAAVRGLAVDDAERKGGIAMVDLRGGRLEAGRRGSVTELGSFILESLSANFFGGTGGFFISGEAGVFLSGAGGVERAPSRRGVAVAAGGRAEAARGRRRRAARPRANAEGAPERRAFGRHRVARCARDVAAHTFRKNPMAPVALER